MDVPGEYRSGSKPPACLGHPSHLVEPGEMLCRICGHFVQGALLGAYQVLELLGTGRSGRAYRAMYMRRQQPVTLKLYPLDMTNMNFWTLMQREMNQARQLRHPCILPVQSNSLWHSKATAPYAPSQSMSFTIYQREVSGEESFLLVLYQFAPTSVLQFLDVMSKRHTGAQTISTIRLFIEQAAYALSIAHRQGLAHGSLVPGNFLLENRQHLWIADFGLGRLHPPPSPYLAPELIPYITTSVRGGEWVQWDVVTPTSDQYAFAVQCWQWLTPFVRIDGPMMAIFQRAMQPNPRARFATIDEFVGNLLAQLQHYSPRMEEMDRRTDTPRSLPGTMLPLLNGAGASPDTKPSLSWMKRGDTYFAERKYNEAIYAYKHSLDEEGRRATTWIALGDAHFALEQYPESLRAYDEAIAVNVDNATAWFNRGTVLDAMGRHADAEMCYARSQLLSES